MRFWLTILLIAVAAVMLVTIDKASAKEPPHPRRTQCHDARRAVVFYRGSTWRWQQLRHSRALADRKPRVRGRSCVYAREAAREWQARSAKARVRFHAWRRYQHDWWMWLPSKWQRIGACETGYGKRPGNWRHDSGAYQGAFGFAVSSWDSFVPSADPKAGPYPSEAYLATPRQQYEVALAIYRRYGLSGWGCRAA